MLQLYPFREIAEELLTGFKEGFRLQYVGPRIPTMSKNLSSASTHPDQLRIKLEKEIELGRILGPFNSRPISNLIVSPIGVLPKPEGPWRLITHLSYPTNESINDFIDPTKCSVHYSSIDEAADMIMRLGTACLCAKCDIKSAFRLMPVHPGDFSLLGYHFQDKFYVDKCLPMGCSISCSLFEKFSTFLEWSLRNRSGMNSVVHYLDDFLFAGSSETGDCKKLMEQFYLLCETLGVPLAKEKTEGPTTSLVFLGMEINTREMSIKIPQEKVKKLNELLQMFLHSSKVTLKEMQSLVGLLNFCSRAVRSSRAFNRRFYDSMIGISKAHHFIKLNTHLIEDIEMWIYFLKNFNGVCLFHDVKWSTNEYLELYTDSAGCSELGCGAYFQGHWVFYSWPHLWGTSTIMNDITFLELVPIVLALFIWGRHLQEKKILFHTDNKALVSIINKQSSKSKHVMSFLRKLVLLSMQFNFQFRAQHIEGVFNNIADAISRKQWSRFRVAAPEADIFPEIVPKSFHSLISGVKLQDY